MHNVAGKCLAALQAIFGVSPPPYLEKLQVAAARLGLVMLRPMQLLLSGDGPSSFKPGAVWIRGGDFEQVQLFNIQLMAASRLEIATVNTCGHHCTIGKTKRIYANMGIKLKMCWKNSMSVTVHNATLSWLKPHSWLTASLIVQDRMPWHETKKQENRDTGPLQKMNTA